MLMGHIRDDPHPKRNTKHPMLINTVGCDFQYSVRISVINRFPEVFLYIKCVRCRYMESRIVCFACNHCMNGRNHRCLNPCFFEDVVNKGRRRRFPVRPGDADDCQFSPRKPEPKKRNNTSEEMVNILNRTNHIFDYSK